MFHKSSLIAALAQSASVRPVVKICCIKSAAEAALAISCGARALGLVVAMPGGPGISEQTIAGIAATVSRSSIATFLLTSETSPESIIAQQRRCGTNTIQLCDHVSPDAYPFIRERLPAVALVQVVQVTGPESVAYAISAAEYVDALLLDSGDLTTEGKQLGDTDRVHDWVISRQIRDAVPVPVFLAGGITAANVGEAIAAVQPFGLDLCSSVRTRDDLDPVKLRMFFEAVTKAADSPRQA